MFCGISEFEKDFINNVKTDLNKGLFYASYNDIFIEQNYYHDNFVLEEILIYLTNIEHQNWKNVSGFEKKNNIFPSFYSNIISQNKINPNTFYEEGIMNA